jgi:hypothetical protein
LQACDDINKAIRKVTWPCILSSEDSILIAVGGTMLTPLGGHEWSKALIGLVAVYYCINLTYAVGQDTALLFLQTRVLGDDIHKKDMTSAFRKALESFDAFMISG